MNASDGPRMEDLPPPPEPPVITKWMLPRKATHLAQVYMLDLSLWASQCMRVLLINEQRRHAWLQEHVS